MGGIFVNLAESPSMCLLLIKMLLYVCYLPSIDVPASLFTLYSKCSIFDCVQFKQQNL